MASGIFMSYRRDDTRHVAGRLADDLTPHFGAGNIFRDIEAIDPGVDFVLALEQALKSCVVMLVLIGPQWIDARDAQGRRRLDSEFDWIRTEIAEALRRGVRVIPMLVEGAGLPAEESLPVDLRALIRRQALELSDSRWRSDVQRLVETLAKVPGLRRLTVADSPGAAAAATGSGSTRPPRAGKGQLWLGIAIGALGLLGVAAYLSEQSASYEPSSPPSNLASNPPPSNRVAEDPAADAPVQDAPATRSATASPNAPAANPAVTPDAAADLPNLAGRWHGDNGMSYSVMQSGVQVAIVSYQNGVEVGQGQGYLNGKVLNVAMSELWQGMGIVNYQCSMQAASSDFSGFTGICQAPDGTQAPARLFR
jgi:TIR domain